ncbi:glucose-fructose oxidoreductase [Halobacteriales archaeon SW_7_68_16]|nr:MAG: glucose-fructose oxidoreductase [Halobacteriales archaeon SW_7_68_16]
MDIEAYLDGFDERDWATGVDGTVRIAVAGLGWWTTDMALPAIAEVDNCEATVAVSGDPEKAERVADRFAMDAAITYEGFHDGAATDAYDAVYVCTPNATHLELCASAADHGAAVLCEKPMEADSERARRLVEACRSVPLMVAYRMHTEPTIRRARDLLRAGTIGDPVAVHGHMSQRLLEMIPDPDQWRLDPALAGPGTSVTDLGIYPINTARFVLEADPVRVAASAGSPNDGFENVPDERAAFLVEFDDGCRATCMASQNASRSGGFRVVGTEGELVLEPAFFADESRTLTVARGEQRIETTAPTVDQMGEEFAYFADRVLSGEPAGGYPSKPEPGTTDSRAGSHFSVAVTQTGTWTDAPARNHTSSPSVAACGTEVTRGSRSGRHSPGPMPPGRRPSCSTCGNWSCRCSTPTRTRPATHPT